MPYEPFERVALGRSALRITRLGFGGASIGGLYRPIADEDAVAVIRHALVARHPAVRRRAAVRLRQRRAADGCGAGRRAAR